MQWPGSGRERETLGRVGLRSGPGRGRLGLWSGVKSGKGETTVGEERGQSWVTDHNSAKQGGARARGWRWSRVKATKQVRGMGRGSDEARQQSKAGERTGGATVVDRTRSEVMAEVGKGGTGSKGNAGGGWAHSIRMREHSRSDTCCHSAWVTIGGGHYERGRPEGRGQLPWEQ